LPKQQQQQFPYLKKKDLSIISMGINNIVFPVAYQTCA